jgi:DNA-binding NarL/FixJ family response regulator
MPDTDSVALISHLFACKKDSRVLIFGASAGKEHLPDRKRPVAENPFERLSAKERLIAQYYLKGYTSTEIKKILCLHASTIGTFKTRLFEKLKIKSLIDLFELARVHQPEPFALPSDTL